MGMLKKDMIAALKLKGIDKVYPKTLSRVSKAEIEKVYQLIIENDAPLHLSYSSVNAYVRCPMQYFYRYKQGMTQPPGVALTMGGSYDEATGYNYKQKITTGKDEPLDAVQDAFREAIKQRRDETDWGEEDPNEAESMGLDLVSKWHEELAPRTIPTAVQYPYLISFDNTLYKFKGFADVIGHTDESWLPTIIENKTSKSNYNQKFVDAHPQLTAYAACHRAEQQINPLLVVDVAVKTKTKQANRFHTRRAAGDFTRWWRTVERVYQAICAGAWYPTSSVFGSQANWVCTEKFCGYWHTCHEEV